MTVDASLFWRALSVAYAAQSPLLRELCWAWSLGNAVPPLPRSDGSGGSVDLARATERLLDREVFRHLSARAQVASSASVRATEGGAGAQCREQCSLPPAPRLGSLRPVGGGPAWCRR